MHVIQLLETEECYFFKETKGKDFENKYWNYVQNVSVN